MVRELIYRMAVFVSNFYRNGINFLVRLGVPYDKALQAVQADFDLYFGHSTKDLRLWDNKNKAMVQ